MRFLTLSLALIIGAAALAEPWAAGQAPDAPKQLSKADAEWATKKHDEALVFGRAGKWDSDEAQAPIREIVALCTRELGKDHYLTRDYQREIDVLKKLAVLPEASRLEYVKTYVLYDKIKELRKERRYAEALPPV